MHAWICENPTGVDDLVWKEVPTPELGPGEVRLAVRAASLNFPDILIIQNKYQIKPSLPFVPGSEYAGVVEAVARGSGASPCGCRSRGATPCARPSSARTTPRRCRA